MPPRVLIFDSAPSSRSVDENGFLHVKSSHITKATVNPYYGHEIPGYERLRLEPDKIYYGFRDPGELRKSAPTWEGLPLHVEHHPDSADEPAKLTRVGAVGKAFWNAPYIDAPLTIWDRSAIDGIEDGSFRELSCAYRYEPDFTPGQFEGVDYDFVMRDIRGNHVALVEEGRAGPDVLVADAALDAEKGDGWITAENGKRVHFKDKEIDKGNVGQKKPGTDYQSSPIESTKPDTARYQELLKQQDGNHQKAAHEYFREKLQGRHVEAQTDEGPIQATFTGGTWREIKRDMNRDALKAELVPHMPDIIATGACKRNELHKERKDGSAAFYEYRKKVETSEGRKEVIVDVAEKPGESPSHVAYNMTREGSKNYEDRKKKTSTADSGSFPRASEVPDSNAVIKNKITPQHEVVNIRLAEKDGSAMAGDRKEKTTKGAFMSKFKKKVRKWLGAQDDNPEIEKQEVDLAQAIIDLHKVDPETGEIVDITEDEDKAEEIRKLIGELSGKLDPEEVKKLTDALSDLAYSKATGDSEPGNGKESAMDEEIKKAMDACGLDSDDDDASKAFAEGVKYGESLERDPAEREKLDREHESEGFRKAMGDCGLDAENPQESRAFAEGVKYGEKLERDPEERKKLDSEHESEGMKKAMGKDEDKNAAIERILAGVPGLTPEQTEKLKNSLADLAYSPATGDEEITAQDRALFRKFGRTKGPKPLLATDAAVIQARAVAQAQDNMRRIAQAVRDVRPLVGDLDALAFDSSADVYGYALEQSGVNPARYSRIAWRGMVDMLRRQKSGAPSGRRFAKDSAPGKMDGQFAGLNNISIAD